MRRFVDALAVGSLHDEAHLESETMAPLNYLRSRHLSTAAALFDVGFFNQTFSLWSKWSHP